ncbi:hypothetical protein BSKO_09601 [Bryopsis sp. KO-2023]|nr:hypothetical protein BSKO_09601 [Bryopsis sp. KO-2023]
MGSRSEKPANGAECRFCGCLDLDDPARPVPEKLVDALQHLQTFSHKVSEISTRESDLLKRQYESWLLSNAKLVEEKAELSTKLALVTEEQKKVKEFGEIESKKLAARETRIVTQEQEIKRREMELIERESSFEEYRKRFELEVAKAREHRDENRRLTEHLKQRETEFKESEDDLIGREDDFRCKMERTTLEITERSEIIKQRELKISAQYRILEEEQAELNSRRIWIQEQITKIIRFHEEIWPKLRRVRQAEMDWLKREGGFLSQWLEKKEDFIITDQIKTTSHNELTPMTVRSEGRGWFGNVFTWKGGSGSRKAVETTLEELEQEFGISERIVTETTMITTTNNTSGKRRPSPSPSEPPEQVKRQRITTTATNASEAAAASAPSPPVETGETTERTTRLRKRRMAAES